MKKKTDIYKQHLTRQKEVLNKAIIQLKSEFIGIDEVIDQIGDAITSWIYFPEMQDRPVIINLWGLTGTGKTSVVKRLTELLGYGERYYHFDLGESTGRFFDIQDSFKEIYDNCDGEPFIIGLDEFQLSRTINEEQQEVDKATTRVIWELLDNGKFEIIDFDYNLGWFGRHIKQLDAALTKGVEVEEGKIITNESVYKTIMQIDESDNEDEQKGEGKLNFIDDISLNKIYSIVEHLYLSSQEIRDELDRMNGDKTIAFLVGLHKKATKPKTIDCTKALIFIMGNLDEVYSMNKNFNPDMNADEFHRQSKEITVTQIKGALVNRFRSEQIARLGNIHIIYPAFDRKSFFAIIRKELEKIRQKVTESYGLNMVFDQQIEYLIYEEGVYPTQGTRPLFTTVHQIIHSRLGKILNEVYLNNFNADTIEFTINRKESNKDCAELEIRFLKKGKQIHRVTDIQPLVLGKLRKEKRNDEQAIVAVHESGHAILSSVLMRTIPDAVLSVTADSESDGFVLSRPQWNYISKKEIINRLAVLLGGFLAEKIIFGEENVTIGSSSDIQKATGLATQVLYTCGMGSSRVAFGNEHMCSNPSVIFDKGEETVNQEAKLLVIEAEKVAQKTLEEQKILLLRMADYLSDKRLMDKELVKEYIRKYAVNFDIHTIIEEKDAENLFYRNHLKELVKQIP